jgi:hypothetical protein
MEEVQQLFPELAMAMDEVKRQDREQGLLSSDDTTGRDKVSAFGVSLMVVTSDGCAR